MSMKKLSEMFPHCLILWFCDLNWPLRLSDFLALDSFLWGYLKSCILKMQPAALDELGVNIREVINDMLKCVMDFTKHLQECILL